MTPTKARQSYFKIRNKRINDDFAGGMPIVDLCAKYNLTAQTLRKLVGKQIKLDAEFTSICKKFIKPVQKKLSLYDSKEADKVWKQVGVRF